MSSEKTTVVPLEKTVKKTVITVDDRAATRQSIIHQIRDHGHGFVERSDWGAKPYRELGLEMDWDYSKIAIHHAGRSFSCGVGAFQMQNIQADHMSGHLKADDIGYHYALDCSGNVFEGRDIRFKGSSVSNFNSNLIGIVLLENLTSSNETFGSHFSHTIDELPLKQKEATETLISVLCAHFHIAVLGGHREFPNQLAEGKICPCNIGVSYVNSLRNLFRLSKP